MLALPSDGARRLMLWDRKRMMGLLAKSQLRSDSARAMSRSSCRVSLTRK